VVGQWGDGGVGESLREDQTGVNREGGVGFNYEIFKNGVWEWGIEEKQGMPCYDYVQGRWSVRSGLDEKQERGEESILLVIEEHPTIEKFRVGVQASPRLLKSLGEL